MANEKKAAAEKRSGVGLKPATMALVFKAIGAEMVKTGTKPTADEVIHKALAAALK